MRIEVTVEDIQYGQRRDCMTCPIALALKRATGESWSVGDVNGYPRSNPSYTVFWPHEVSAWIEQCDFDRPVQPFSFEIEV